MLNRNALYTLPMIGIELHHRPILANVFLDYVEPLVAVVFWKDDRMFTNHKEFYKYEEYLKKHRNFKSVYEENSSITFIFYVPSKYVTQLELLKEGKYSKLDKRLKTLTEIGRAHV